MPFACFVHEKRELSCSLPNEPLIERFGLENAGDVARDWLFELLKHIHVRGVRFSLALIGSEDSVNVAMDDQFGDEHVSVYIVEPNGVGDLAMRFYSGSRIGLSERDAW